MTREEAKSLVEPRIKMVDQYQAVSHKSAWALLGDYRFDLIMKDAIHRCGPKEHTIYPWNVVDYLLLPEAEIEE